MLHDILHVYDMIQSLLADIYNMSASRSRFSPFLSSYIFQIFFLFSLKYSWNNLNEFNFKLLLNEETNWILTRENSEPESSIQNGAIWRKCKSSTVHRFNLINNVSHHPGSILKVVKKIWSLNAEEQNILQAEICKRYGDDFQKWFNFLKGESDQFWGYLRFFSIDDVIYWNSLNLIMNIRSFLRKCANNSVH